MRIIDDTIQGDVRLTEDLMLRGMLAGDATVPAGITVWLHGMVTGDLTVQPGARVELHGMVCGDVINRGHIEVWGMINGRLDDDGDAVVHAGAVIRGERW